MAFRGIGLLYLVGGGDRNKIHQGGYLSARGDLVMGTSQVDDWVGDMRSLKIAWPSCSLVHEGKVADDEGRTLE